MFQLIVAVISIALVSALAIASIYYGGTAFQASSLKANVTTLVNSAQQISGAVSLYSSDFGGSKAYSVATLLTPVNGATYLASAPGVPSIAPAGGQWGIESTGSYAYLVVNPSANLTTAVNAAAGGEPNPQFGLADGVSAIGAGAGTMSTAATAGLFWFKL